MRTHARTSNRGGLIARARATCAFTWIWRLNGLHIAEAALSRAPRGAVLQRPLFGGRLSLDLSRTSVHRRLFLEGERFVEERFLLRRLLTPGDVVCDVGANIGYYLLLAEQCVGPNGEVLCIEPEPDNLEDLQRLVVAND